MATMRKDYARIEIEIYLLRELDSSNWKTY